MTSPDIPLDLMKPKRDRSANFSHLETQLLVNVIYKYGNIIENKTTNAIMWRKKEETWKRITAEFNSQNSLNRSIKVLKIKYESLKRGLKKKTASNRIETFKSGGGCTIAPYTDYEEKILAILAMGIQGIPARDIVTGKIKNVGIPMYKNKWAWNQRNFKKPIHHIQKQDVSYTDNQIKAKSCSLPVAESEIHNIQLNLIKQEQIDENDILTDQQNLHESHDLSIGEQDLHIREEDLLLNDQNSLTNELNHQCNEHYVTTEPEAFLQNEKKWREKEHKLRILYKQKKAQCLIWKNERKEKEHALRILTKEKKLEFYILNNKRKEKEHAIKMQLLQHQLKCVKT